MDLAAAVALLAGSWQKRPENARDELAIGARVGRYRITGATLGTGGSATVYPATDDERGGAFALKWAKPGLRVHEIFLEERHKARLLNHHHILVACDDGVHEGRPYLVFRRLDRHFTEQVRRERYRSARAIAELMHTLAGALSFAHGRGVLHCDLKASNILFEGERPHIADFGLARTIEASSSRGNATGGTVGWMSPEQANKAESLGAASDVFSFGILLFWLLHDGVLPFGNDEDFAERVRRQEPRADPAKRPLSGLMASDLATICTRALQKVPDARYRSADELEEDLRRALNRELPRAATRWVRIRRLSRWVVRRPVVGLVALSAMALPPFAFAIQNDTLRELRAAQRPQAHFTAEAQARAVKSELLGMGLRVDAMARDPAVLELLDHGGIDRPAPALERYAAGFDSVNVFTADGTHPARWPVGPAEAAINVRHSDHFVCAERLADALARQPPRDATELLVCVARAHRSALDGNVKLGLAAPILDAGRFVGVVEASIMARERFGALRMSCGPDDCFSALLGPRDRGAAQQGLPEVLSVLAQEGVRLGSEVRLPPSLNTKICRDVGCAPDPLRPFAPNPSQPFEIDDYEDPVSRTHSFAVVAPVARTGLSVVLAMPHGAANAKAASIASAAAGRVWVPLSFAVVLWLVLLLFETAPAALGRRARAPRGHRRDSSARSSASAPRWTT